MEKFETSTNILIIGGGRGGNALLQLLINEYDVNIVGLVDINVDSPGIQTAKKHNIPVGRNIKKFLKKCESFLDVIVDTTGSEKLYDQLKEFLPPNVTFVHNKATTFVWKLIEASKNSLFLKEQNKILKESINENKKEDIIYGTNPLMIEIKEQIHQVAPTSATVLILGETGTGKELIASAIQQASKEQDHQFIKLNCTTLSSQLLERELFGSVNIRSTSMGSEHVGVLEKASGGTVFLDEIGGVSKEIQIKLLRFLQHGEVTPLGSKKTIHVKTRLITATNKNLEVLVSEMVFRKDLYHNLNSFVISLPPLRERKEDIAVLAYLFLNKSAATLNKIITSISTSAMEVLTNYDYPGNIRELQSIIERAITLCEDNTLKPHHLSGVGKTDILINKNLLDLNGFTSEKNHLLDRFEKEAVEYFIWKAHGNVTTAANLAMTPRRSFYRLVDKYKIDNNKFKLK